MTAVDLRLVDRLHRMAEGITVGHLLNATQRDGPPEPVLQGRMVEVLRHCLDALEPSPEARRLAPEIGLDHSQPPTPETIAAVYGRLLPVGPDHDEARAWAVYLLDPLTQTPSAPDELVARLVDVALGTSRLGDGLVPRGTPLDTALADLIDTGRRDIVRDRTVRARVACGADPALVLDNYLVQLAVLPDELVVDGRITDTGERWFDDRLAALEGDDAHAAVIAAGELLEALYQWHEESWPKPGTSELARPDVLDDERRERCFETLLRAAEADGPASDLSAWTLTWLTVARSPVGDGRDLTARRRGRLRAVVADRTRSTARRSDLALVLALHPPRAPLAREHDWIMEWAVVADGAMAPRRPRPAAASPRDPDVAAVRSLVADIAADLGDPIVVRRGRLAGLALGRLDGDGPGLGPVLLALFREATLGSWLRDEALTYLCRAPGPLPAEARSVLVEEARSRVVEEADDTYEQVRGLLAIVGTGDVDAMRDLFLGREETGKVPWYEPAYVRALGRSPDPRGEDLLRELLDHPDERITRGAARALGQ